MAGLANSLFHAPPKAKGPTPDQVAAQQAQTALVKQQSAQLSAQEAATAAAQTSNNATQAAILGRYGSRSLLLADGTGETGVGGAAGTQKTLGG